MPPHKPDFRLLEGSVFAALSPAVLTTQSSLSELTEAEAEKFHLYAICRRPRMRMRPDALLVDADTISVAFELEGPGGGDRVLEVPNRHGTTQIEVRNTSAATRFELIANGEVQFEQDAGWWLSQRAFAAEQDCGSKPRPEFDLEVLYVGQAYGDGGSRTASERLVSHSTLQRIYAEINEQAPHFEVSIALLGMESPVQAVRLGGEPSMTDDEALGEFTRLITAAPSHGQQVNLAEAALIKYFRPFCNEKFKNVFPSKSHTSYAECYSLDLNSVGFTLNGRTLFGRLFSEAVEPKWIHTNTYFLHNEAERRDMFSFVPELD